MKLILAVLIALAPTLAFADLDDDIADLESVVRQLRKEVSAMQKYQLQLLDAQAQWRKEQLRIDRAHDSALKDIDKQAAGAIKDILDDLKVLRQNTGDFAKNTLRLIKAVETETLHRCATMIERHGQITGQKQPRDLKDRLLRGFR